MLSLLRQSVSAATIGTLIFASAAASGAATTDMTFAKKAAMGGLGEVALARIALQNGSSPAVKAFAQRMIADHGQANAKLMAIAKRKGIMLPSTVDPTSAMMRSKLQSLHGAAFDRAYLDGQRGAHIATESLMRDEIANGSDAALVSFAKTTLPTVEAHLSLDKSSIGQIGKM